MDNRDLLDRLDSAIKTGAASVDLLQECWRRIAEVEQRFSQIREYCRDPDLGKDDPGELRGALEEIEALCSYPPETRREPKP